jgi:hypothetical protein
VGLWGAPVVNTLFNRAATLQQLPTRTASQHESRPEPVIIARPADAGEDDATRTNTRVLQPGSTVATSLCEGEAAKKHTFLLEVRPTE